MTVKGFRAHQILSAILVLTSSCSFDFGNVPEGAQITCKSTADCPTGWVCSTSTGLCIDPGKNDQIPPAIDGELAVTPSLLKAGATAKISFKATKVLNHDPEVSIRLGEDDVPLEGGVKDDGSYEYNYTAKGGGTESEEFPAQISIKMVDKFGNIGNARATVRFDFTPPAVAGIPVIVLFPPASGLIESVSKVGVGTTAQITFTTTEILAKDPEVNLDPVSGSWETSKTISGGATWQYGFKLTGGEPVQGKYHITVKLTDMAGNESDYITLELPEEALIVDTIPPTPIGSTQNDMIICRRLPWGDTATNGKSRIVVETTGPNAVEPDSVLIVRDSNGREVGRLEAGSDGTIDYSDNFIENIDSNRIFLSQIDKAGNIDTISGTLLKNIEWSITLWNKVSGSTFENPSILQSCGITVPNYYQDSNACHEFTQEELKMLLKPVPDLLTRSSGDRWIELPGNSATPGARRLHSMAFDSARGVVVMFGGVNEHVFNNSMWEWDGYTGTWTDRSVGGSKPGVRSGQAMAYDSNRGKMVMFGGGEISTGNNYKQDTWEWDPLTGIWTEREPVTKPEGRAGHSMAFDSSSGKIVLFGGMDSKTSYNDLWEWDGNSGEWEYVTPATTAAPNQRSSHAMAFDGIRQKIVVHGGTRSNSIYKDVWEWDRGTHTWVNRTPSSEGPDGREGHTMVFNPTNKKIIMFGGHVVYPFEWYSNEIWEWDGEKGVWKDTTPAAGIEPAGRYYHSMVYDYKRGGITIFGGSNNYYLSLDDLWNWNPSAGAWTERTTTGQIPNIRSDFATAYDSVQNTTVIFGGAQKEFAPFFNDTWEWRHASKRWFNTTPQTGNPGPRTGHAMAYDVAGDKIVLFGGKKSSVEDYDDLWEWDANTSTWADKTPSESNPDARRGHTLTYDDTRKKIILFGGIVSNAYKNDLWEWDILGEKWTEIQTNGDKPGERYEHAAVYIEKKGKLLLFGGYDGSQYLNDLWEWDSNTANWTKLEPSGDKPTARAMHSMVYDNRRDKVLLFGGGNVDDLFGKMFGDVWEWDGEAWKQRTEFIMKPSPRRAFGMTYDSLAETFFVFGGETFFLARLNDVWEWNGGADEFPAFVYKAPFFSAGAEGKQKFKSVRVDFNAGGMGQPDGIAEDGAVIKAWVESAWVAQDGAFNTSGPDNPSWVSWSTSDPVTMRRMIFGPEQYFTFAVSPKSSNGTGLGKISINDVVFTVRYKLCVDAGDCP